MTPAQRKAVVLLALGQTMTYSGVYYSFPALLPDIEAATGWSKSALAMGPALACLLMAVFAPFTGRLVDRGFGGEMLAYLPVPAALAVALMGFVQNPWQWLLLWSVVGVVQAGCLYETCFAFLTRRLGASARPAIVLVTLIAGFAGTLSFPFGHFLGDWFGAKGALIGFACLMVLAGVPATVFGVRIMRATARLGEERRPDAPGHLRHAARQRVFWSLAVILGLIYLNHAIFITYVLELFTSRGASADLATLAAAMIGPCQVGGRFVLMLNEARIGNRRATFLSLGGLVLTALALWLAGFAPGLVLLAAMAQGAGIGIVSILRPVLIAEHLGRDGFGAISGAIAVSPILASAAGPLVGAWLLDLAGPGLVIAACGGLAVLAAGFAFRLRRPVAQG